MRLKQWLMAISGLFEKAGEPVLDLSAWIMKKPHCKRYTLEETWLQRNEREAYRSTSMQPSRQGSV
jgi:hypothetical protein